MAERHAPPRPLRDSESREVVAEAWKLQDEAERHADADRRTREMAVAAAEVGLDAEHLPLAEGLVRARVEERARREVERTRLLRAAAIGVGAVALLGVAAVVVWPSPPVHEPWSTDFSAAGSEWQMEVSPGSAATLTWPTEAGHGTVATVAVDALAPMADGRYLVNVDTRAHPDWAGATRVSFATRGEAGEGLDQVRLFLETPTERWRGPPLPVTADWHTHVVDLTRFERQEKRGSAWEVVAWAPPATVETISFKLGWYVNDAGARGTVTLDDLRVE